MTTKTTTAWEVVRGFGDFVDAPRDCFDVQVMKRKFSNEADAIAFSESHYDKRVLRLMRTMPDWWKSFFVTVREITTTPDRNN